MGRTTKFALLAGILLALPASAQRAGEITFFSQIGFQGRSFTVTGPRTTLHLGWPVRSARIRAGDTWEICTQSNFRSCQRVSSTQGNIRWNVASVRPAPRPVPPIAPQPPGQGQSLRGMTAEFFVAPRDTHGGRVLSCASGAAACASQAADRFCLSRGWIAAAYERQETVGGRNYLTDILCTRTHTR